MTPFTKPTKNPGDGPHYPELVKMAVTRALEDACIDSKLIEQAVVGNMFAGGGAGQRSLYEMGIFDIPIYNVSNACATGSNALYLARQFIQGGLNDCCLAVGVEKMAPGSLGGAMTPGAPTPMDLHFPVMMKKYEYDMKAPPMPQMFGNAGREHMAKYGTTAKQFAMIGEKNHRHSVNNPYAQFRNQNTLEEVESARMVYEPLTKLQCSPTSDGAGAAIVCSEEFVVKHGLQGQAVEIVGQSMMTDTAESFDAENIHDRSCIDMIGAPMARNCADEVYRQAKMSAEDVDVVELHDCFSCNELITYESLGLCGEGEGGKLIESGDCTYGGKYVVNPSGGLISKGHPLGATGLAQCAELNWQLRGECGPRQVDGATVGLQHNLGLGGACVITLYKRPEEWKGSKPKRAVSGAMGFTTKARL
jgi:acetyl-CoA acetyltransferase